jgi:hypothetical protein
VLAAGPSSERIHKQRHTAYQQQMQQQHEHTLLVSNFHNPRIVDRGPRSPFDTSPRRAARASAHASLAAACMHLLLPPAASQGPPPPHAAHIHQRFWSTLWKRPFVVTPSTTLPRPSAGCALDAATMDGSTGGMGPAPNTAPKASPPAAKATPKPSAACYEATELAIRLA